jgi:hypothetical protein
MRVSRNAAHAVVELPDRIQATKKLLSVNEGTLRRFIGANSRYRAK